MGDSHNSSRLQTTVCNETPHVREDCIFSRDRAGSGCAEIRNTLIDKQESYQRSLSEREQDGFLFSLFSRAEKGRGATSHTRPPCSQQAFEELSFQNVDSGLVDAFSPPGRLVDKRGSPRRLLSCPYIRTTPEISPFRFRRETLRIFGSSVWDVALPESLCEGDTSSSCPPETTGRTSGYVLGRLADQRRLATGGAVPDSASGKSPLLTGFQHKSREERFGAYTNDRLYRHNFELSLFHGQAESGESEIVPCMPRTFSAGPQGSVWTVSQDVRSYGVGRLASTPRQTTDETVSNVAEISPNPLQPAPQACSGYRRVYASSEVVERSTCPDRGGPYGDDPLQESDHHGRQSVGVGSHHGREDGQGHVECQLALRPYKLSGIDGGPSSSSPFRAVHSRVSRADPHRQHHDGLLHKQAGRGQIPPAPPPGMSTDFVVPRPPSLCEGVSRPGSPQRRSGLTVQRSSPLRGVVSTPGGDDAALGQVRDPRGGLVRLSGEHEVSPVLLDGGCGPSGRGRPGTRVASDFALCFSSTVLDSPHVGQSEDPGPVSDPDSASLGVVEVGDNSTPVRSTVEASATGGPAHSSETGNISSSASGAGPVGLARERLNLQAEGLPPNVIATIQGARAQSTRKQYDVAWRVFERWCAERPGQVVPYLAPVSDVLTFLQGFLDEGKSFSTVKVNLAAISACHIGIGGKTLGEFPLVRRFMRGANRARPVSRSLAPPWDVSLVLDALTREPFEPLDSVDLKFLSLKTALLLALTTAKRVSDLHALSSSTDCTSFSADGLRVTLKPNPAFVPKNFLSRSVPADLRSFYPPPHTSEEDRLLHSLCPVRALTMYLRKTASFREGSQLFVAFGAGVRGKPITKVRLSRWIVEAIQLAYVSKGTPPPGGLRAHSTRGISASWALFRGVSIQDVCAAASWSSPSTFARFYNLDVAESSLAHSVLGVVSARGRPRR